MKKTRIKKRKVQLLMSILVFFIIFIVVGAAFAVKLYQKYSPSKERMPYEQYFEMYSPDEIIVYINDQVGDINVLYEGGEYYLPMDYVKSNLNCRFYFDQESNAVMYTVADNMFTFATNQPAMIDMYGTVTTTDYPVVRSDAAGNLYLAIDYVQSKADLQYRFYSEPNRLLIWTEYEERAYTTLTKDTAIRFRGGIKSPIIADGLKDQKVEYLQDLEDWVEIRTEDGYMGYVSSKCVGDIFSETMTSTFVEEERPVPITFDGPINLAYQAIGGSGFGGDLLKDALKPTHGINVLSPTWYKLSDNSGNVTSFANKTYVQKSHELGIQVWALIDDFDANVDKTVVLSSKATRARLINRLVSDALSYGFDGINLDFEKITVENVDHYLQFIRELSFETRKNGIILAINNYCPAAHNLFYNRKEQGIWVDYSIIMGYDEHWNGSDAGPVASISYVDKGIADTIAEVPAEKVINAMPYYVRIWTETLNLDNSVTTTSKAVGMDTAKATMNSKMPDAAWYDELGCKYGQYEEGNNTVKIWLEDAKSIEAKMQCYQKYGIKGVAGWRMGLESSDVWDVIEQYLR